MSSSSGTAPSTTPPLDLSSSNIVMMIYRQAVFIVSLVCLFWFKSPLRASVLSLTKSYSSEMGPDVATRAAAATATTTAKPL